MITTAKLSRLIIRLEKSLLWYGQIYSINVAIHLVFVYDFSGF